MDTFFIQRDANKLGVILQFSLSFISRNHCSNLPRNDFCLLHVCCIVMPFRDKLQVARQVTGRLHLVNGTA